MAEADDLEATRRAIRAFIKREQPVQVFTAKVRSVDWDKRSCVVYDINTNEDIAVDVRLRAVIDNAQSGLCLKPKVDSYVLVGIVDNMPQSCYLVQCTGIDAIELRTDDGEVLNMDIANGQVDFNGGDNGGMAIVEKLVSEYNAIRHDLNSLKTAIAGWVVAPQDGGAALKSATATWAGQQLTDVVKSDIENTKVKH